MAAKTEPKDSEAITNTSLRKALPYVLTPSNYQPVTAPISCDHQLGLALGAPGSPRAVELRFFRPPRLVFLS